MSELIGTHIIIFLEKESRVRKLIFFEFIAKLYIFLYRLYSYIGFTQYSVFSPINTFFGSKYMLKNVHALNLCVFIPIGN